MSQLSEIELESYDMKTLRNICSECNPNVNFNTIKNFKKKVLIKLIMIKVRKDLQKNTKKVELKSVHATSFGCRNIFCGLWNRSCLSAVRLFHLDVLLCLLLCSK